jgi:hypothetical protein
VPRLTAIEIDERLAASLKMRLAGTNVTVIEGDATAMPFPDASFSAAISFTMLHHVPSSGLQDRLLAEAACCGPVVSSSAPTARPPSRGTSTTCSTRGRQ